MIKLSFKNPYIIIVFAILVSVLSFVIVPKMPVDILPQFKKSAMQILTLYPGMPAEVVEKDITSRMERWTGQSNGILKQESKSLMGVSLVTNYYHENVTAAAFALILKKLKITKKIKLYKFFIFIPYKKVCRFYCSSI